MTSQKRLTSFFGDGPAATAAASSSKKRPRSSLHPPLSGSRFGRCPLCGAAFPWHTLESHAANCLGNEGGEEKAVMKTTSSDSSSLVASSSARSAGPQLLSSSSFLGKRKTETQTFKEPTVRPTCEPIPGLYVYENFITQAEEEELLHGLDIVDHLPWKPARFNGKNLGKRWGVHCNLRDRRVDAPEHPLPECLKKIVLPKLVALTPMNGCVPNEANAIDYYKRLGHWLQAHVDDRKLSKEPIANLSLAGDCYMTFRNQAPHRNLACKEQRVLLKRRCLQVLTGKARYDFSHGIDHKDLLSDRRVSVTMRESPLTKSTKPTRSQWNPYARK